MSRHMSRTDECDTCQLRVAELALVMTEEEMVDKMTSQVQGGLFCDMEGAWWDVEMCQVRQCLNYDASPSLAVDSKTKLIVDVLEFSFVSL